MGLGHLSFLRDWKNPADFPTVEPDEATVRADLQYHPDAIKDYINETLIPSHDALTDAKHSHDNKTVLDSITADDVAKLAQEPLDGTTLTLTPTQVYDAVSVGIPVKVQYFDGTYGSFSFTVFNVESLNVIVSQRIVYADRFSEYILVELTGNKPDGTWSFMATTLAEKTDIPSLEGYATEAYVQNYHDNTKQDIITDLATIRSGASKGATAVQPEAGKGLFSGSYNDLTDKPTIPDISGKQDKLIAGEGITIAADGKTISSSGADGKTAYQYAQEGGYTGTETEFAEKLASGLMIVTLTDNNGTLSANKSYIEIKNAIVDGIPVLVDYGGTGLPLITMTADALYFGTFQCDSGDASNGAVVATVMIEITPNGEVNDFSAQIDIPKTLPNPNAITFTGAVTGSYDGSTAKTVNIPSAVTDAHINSLIDTKLGVIENGSY